MTQFDSPDRQLEERYQQDVLRRSGDAFATAMAAQRAAKDNADKIGFGGAMAAAYQMNPTERRRHDLHSAHLAADRTAGAI